MKNNILIPGTLMLMLTFICIALILTGLNAALKTTDWSKDSRRKIFFTAFVFIVLWTGLLTVLSLQGFFSDFSKLPPRPALAIVDSIAFYPAHCIF